MFDIVEITDKNRIETYLSVAWSSDQEVEAKGGWAGAATEAMYECQEWIRSIMIIIRMLGVKSLNYWRARRCWVIEWSAYRARLRDKRHLHQHQVIIRICRSSRAMHCSRRIEKPYC